MNLKDLINWHLKQGFQQIESKEKEIILKKGTNLIRRISPVIIERSSFLVGLARNYQWKVFAEIGASPGGLAEGLIPKTSLIYLGVERVPSLKFYGVFMRTDSYSKELGRQKKPFGFLRMNSDEAASIIGNEVLDAVFIDAQHNYKDVLEDIRMWHPKVKKGGFIGGHDFNPWGEPNRGGVAKAVSEYYKDFNLFVEPSGNCCWWLYVS